MNSIRNIDVFFSAQSFQENELRNKAVVVIDVLRATSTIVTAIKNGAKAIIPVEDMAEASKISQNVDSDNYLLCGEKDGVKIEGYDLGNSPLEYSPEMISGKTLIFNTTNGTKAIKKSLGSARIYIASFLNFSSVVEALRQEAHDIVLLCAGWKGRLALEDTLLAGMIIHNLNSGVIPDNAPDGAKVAFSIYEKYGSDIKTVVHGSNHAARLKALVGSDDLDYCCQIDLCDMLPILHDGIISITHG
jgi:2-phosphosulfolactate phosphatase